MATKAASAEARHALILRHMPSLDSIRGAAVLMVLFFHGFSGYGWQGLLGGFWGRLVQAFFGCGRFGVNVFFVLSGFLITELLFKARERTDFYRNFYMRRVLRILPIYLVVLAVLWLWHVVDGRFVLAAVLFLANFSKLFGAPLGEYGSLWSLAVEEHFYLLWPTCVRRLGERTLLVLLLMVVIGEPLLRLVGLHFNSHMDVHYKTPFVLDFIAYGALLCLLIRSRRIHFGNVARVGGVVLAVSAVLCTLVVWLAAFHETAPLDALADLPFSWGACGVLLLGLRRDHDRVAATGDNRARGLLPFFGYISYGLYLINVLVYAKGRELLTHMLGAAALDRFAIYASGVFGCMVVATVVAYLSRRFFEEPFLRLKDRWKDRAGSRAEAA
ncbi:acyltransferase [Acidipila sp. EB88]|uniref:acyltransferase family protein n=1 Tax=Acidipila sp. EB88 TaxID=2305226 RepID=UPI000F5D7606|nr:acyltransferase [Acidipila sp. EB88]RRA47288.1 acyltransferase [Acidipila sp. EB88]